MIRGITQIFKVYLEEYNIEEKYYDTEKCEYNDTTENPKKKRAKNNGQSGVHKENRAVLFLLKAGRNYLYNSVT